MAPRFHPLAPALARGVLQESMLAPAMQRRRATRGFHRDPRFFVRGREGATKLRTSPLEERRIQDTTKRVRVNRQIRISPIRVIGADGSQMGIMEVDAALAAAEALGLDLVEVAPTARPPVARIMDYGKYKFEQAKQARIAKKKQHVIQLKEVKYRPGIDDHDFDTKTRHARRFLEEKNKVKVTMMFRGRQVAHPELGKDVLDRVAASLADVSKVESEGRLEGKSMTMILTPK